MIPSPFKEDTWVSAIEIRPGDPSVVHHVILQIPDRTYGLQRVPIVRTAVLRASPSAATARKTLP